MVEGMGRGQSSSKASGGAGPRGFSKRFWNPEEAAQLQRFADAARATFQGMAEDEAGSHYRQAPGLSPDETAAMILRRVEQVSVAMILDAEQDQPLSVPDIGEVHRTIFEPIFGEQTLRMRSHRNHTSQYGVIKGSRDDPYPTTQPGTGGQNVQKKLREILERFEEELAAIRAEEEGELADLVRPAAKLYARFIGAHPFVDGNGRTGFCILTHSLIRCDALVVSLPEHDEFHWCLGKGMQRGSNADFEPLTQYIAERIRASELE